MVLSSRSSSFLFLLCLLVAWSLFFAAIETKTWLHVQISDEIKLYKENSTNMTMVRPSNKDNTVIQLKVIYDFGLTTYCVATEKSWNKKSVKLCNEISVSHPDILEYLHIPESVLANLQRFMALTIFFSTFAVILSILAVTLTHAHRRKVIIFIAVAFVTLAIITNGITVFAAWKELDASPDVFRHRMASKYGTFIVEAYYKGYSFYYACAGVVLLVSTIIFYWVNLRSIEENVKDERAYRMLPSA